ncbi:hypothetical protein [Thermogemmatispora tikiterensis]|uniref:ATP-grasp domain-containing protein n=1 Tax=Thermogemmatispora tikiterensis TaxID=1825093 RepID=A0A328VAZ7_9CHLR|nr:hypothetical protein [Thermogemmatispora tikiterensis]RAQ93901.1 hypothetical protein A4R35_00050 [Thermogemmatispora tikiterensis]
MTRPIVLILTRAEDAHAPPVIQELRRRGVQPVCLDLAELPTLLAHSPLTATLSTSVPNWQGLCLCPREASWKIEEVLSVWWRRPRFPQAADAYAPAVQTFIQHETARGFLGVLAERPVLLTSSGQPQRAAPSASPPCWWLRPCWVNQRERLQAAEYKPAQLQAAVQLGWRIPRTLLTTDPAAARAFLEQCQGRVICKALARELLPATPPLTETQVVYTQRVLPEHAGWLEGVRSAPTLFQEEIPKALELRVVVMGQQIFAFEIYSQASERTRLDWRRCYTDLRYGRRQLSSETERRLVGLLRHFRLQFAAVDLIVTPEGEEVFLELNPAGQWYWLEQQTGVPLAAAMATVLASPEEVGLW